jgi:hypothetical protein
VTVSTLTKSGCTDGSIISAITVTVSTLTYSGCTDGSIISAITVTVSTLTYSGCTDGSIISAITVTVSPSFTLPYSNTGLDLMLLHSQVATPFCLVGMPNILAHICTYTAAHYHRYNPPLNSACLLILLNLSFIS